MDFELIDDDEDIINIDPLLVLEWVYSEPVESNEPVPDNVLWLR